MSIKNIRMMICCKIRFTFWDGKKTYTVHYQPGVDMWYIFDEDTDSDALAQYKPGKKEKVTHDQALYYLTEYLNS